MDMKRTVKKANDAAARRLYAPYAEAEWGFLNHWYPARFSQEVPEGGAIGVQICGVPIVLRRSRGKVYALKDQCLHRGVKLSAKPMCLTEDTITCWYHGFTFSIETGELVSIVAAPDDEIIGTTGIPTFPVEEVNGIVFVFVRSEDWDEDVPPLAQDLPIRFPDNNERFPHPFWPDTPSMLDKDAVALGVHRTGYANWRLACENGFDAGHLLIHKDCTIVQAKDWAVPLGIKPLTDQATQLIEDEDGPKGFINMYFTENYEPVLVNERLGVKASGTVPKYFRTSMFLPGVLMVENWPEEGVVQYEWYVPITDDTYEYWEVLVKRCPTEEDVKGFEYRFKNFYEPMALHGFNDCDLFARDAMQNFYADGTGWTDEQLGDMDYSIITWRKVASRYNRGIAAKPRGVAGVVKGASNVLAEIRGPAAGSYRKTKGE
uniref:Rieske 2Fe-2S domain-containing protein n=2 Tax=Aromatoleum toluolicum TaxID=90060 RepID=A0ABX1NCM0_9RHOO|nr:Rieske 2Fe-2S domain-containing protein [Aromatoleum toluolicum]